MLLRICRELLRCSIFKILCSFTNHELAKLTIDAPYCISDLIYFALHTFARDANWLSSKVYTAILANECIGISVDSNF